MSLSAFLTARPSAWLRATLSVPKGRGAPPPLDLREPQVDPERSRRVALARRLRAALEPQALLTAIGVTLGLQGLALVAFGAAAAGQAAPSAQEVAASLQKKYDTIRDFSTDFVHTHEGGVLKRKREERGTLLVKKPGKMRWNYKAPDEKVFVSDGVRLTQYFADENRALVSAVPENDQAAVLFLAGRGRLTRDFNVSFGQNGGATAWTLRLEPKQPQQEYDWLEVTAARDTFLLQSLTVAEKQGSRSTFVFTNFKENPGLADKTFAFAIPRGAEVTNAGPIKR